MTGHVITPPRSGSTMLRRTLYANAVFSTLCGLEFILFAGPVSRLLGWSALWVVPVIGIGLLGFAAFVYTTARAQRLEPGRVRAILYADELWVVASILMLITGWLPLTLAGKWAVGIVAAMVAVFALLEYLGLRA